MGGGGVSVVPGERLGVLGSKGRALWGSAGVTGGLWGYGGGGGGNPLPGVGEPPLLSQGGPGPRLLSVGPLPPVRET